MKKINILIVGLGLLSFLMTSCQGGSHEEGAVSEETSVTEDAAPLGGQASVSDDESAKNIVQVAVGSPDHTTLVAACQAAGLVDVLANNGPFTVFAPTNAAFEALPAGTVENLLKPENKSALANILKFHVTPGIYRENLFKDGFQLGQAQMDKVTLKNVDGKWTVNGANIIASVDATNGVIHVIDAVLLPPEK
jgi:uncharacterized surface protein with fasciclin (FAS1) repeats